MSDRKAQAEAEAQAGARGRGSRFPWRLFWLFSALASASASASPQHAAAQDWRTVSSSRSFAGEEALRVDVEYGAGRLRVQPGETGTLYRTTLRYDARTFRPVTDYAGGRLRLGLDGTGNLRKISSDGARLDLTLGPDAPLDLELKFGAVEADIELGGLPVRELKVATGASESTLRFTRANPVRMSDLRLEVGAASFRAEGLGNANAERMRITGGVGELTLDFTGAWEGTTDVEVDVGLGSVRIRLPRGTGVRLTKDSFLASVDTDGLTKRGNAYYSPDWDAATARLTLDIDTAFGSVDIDWVDPPVSRH